MTDPTQVSISGEGVDTSYPVLPAGDYPLQIAESVIQSNKKQDGLNWHMKLVTTQEHNSTENKPVKPNYAVFMDIALQASEKATDPEGFKKQIFAAVDGICGTDASNRPLFDRDLVASVVGKTAVAHLTVDEYPQGSGTFNNKVKRIKKAV